MSAPARPKYWDQLRDRLIREASLLNNKRVRMNIDSGYTGEDLRDVLAAAVGLERVGRELAADVRRRIAMAEANRRATAVTS